MGEERRRTPYGPTRPARGHLGGRLRSCPGVVRTSVRSWTDVPSQRRRVGLGAGRGAGRSTSSTVPSTRATPWSPCSSTTWPTASPASAHGGSSCTSRDLDTAFARCPTGPRATRSASVADLGDRCENPGPRRPGAYAATMVASYRRRHSSWPSTCCSSTTAAVRIPSSTSPRWTSGRPAEVDAHVQWMRDFATSCRTRVSSWTTRPWPRRAPSSVTAVRAGRRSPTARSRRPRT